MSRLAPISAFALVLVVTFAGTGASAHPLAPAVLSFMPDDDAETVIMTWRAPVTRPKGQALEPRIPESCTPLSPTSRELVEGDTAVIDTTVLRCEPRTLVGQAIRVDGLTDSTVNVVVRIGRPDGAIDHTILDTRSPSFVVAPVEETGGAFGNYLWLGVEHLVTGWDHLTFVLGLLVLFGWHRRLIAAVTAFTLGHSLTLALSVLGFVSVPQAWVEALIAVTIVALALEIQLGRRGPIWRHPWSLPAFLGLLHGLGFASALFEAGLPADEIPLALFGFNLGLEFGQLGVILVAWIAYRAFRGALPTRLRGNRAVPAYLIGSLAAYWVIERTLSALGLFIA
ncbi:MAG: HupE/UreJ family protein [Myxococcota bacterium]